MRSFPIFLELQAQPVILIGEGPAADAKRRLYQRAGAIIVGEFHPCSKIVVIAEEDDDAAHAAVARCRARGLLINVVDRPALCDFTTPAIVDRNPVTIAIGTGGASAGLAKALRQRLEALLPETLGALAKGLFAARPAIKDTWPDGRERRQAIDAALQPGGPLDPFGDIKNDAVNDWLAEGGDKRQIGIEQIDLASNDPDDLTLKQARLLASADYVITIGSVGAAIMARIRADADILPGPDHGHDRDHDLPADALIIRLTAAATEN
ncbi:siroheme synthase [Parasphingorhabdus sp. DH2-15]|uniref:precorrin-2 dehydrogenase/sirohydrochlorin ferrochelatase family protein n=1 Tax=Parasphingorhabdus sp. DH2-15 TaxID=3444112 RepID=UPI003F686B84